MELPDGRVRKIREYHNVRYGLHELTCSCHQGMRLLNYDRTRQWLVEALDRARKQHNLQFWAYVIMPEHFHLLFRVDGAHYHLSDILKSIKQPVARRAVNYLRKTNPQSLQRLRVAWPNGRIEHRFWGQGGGYDRNMRSSEAIRNSINYLHLNPVRRGLVERAEDWKWSSAGWYRGCDDVVLTMDRERRWET